MCTTPRDGEWVKKHMDDRIYVTWTGSTSKPIHIVDAVTAIRQLNLFYPMQTHTHAHTLTMKLFSHDEWNILAT